jgi:peptide deformylase
MSLLPIIFVPDPVLKTVATPIETINEAIKQQAYDMIETMYAAPGIGLAANQVNKLNRLIVMDPEFRKDKKRSQSKDNALVMINPEIVWKSENLSVMEEGCLSIPQQYAEVERPYSVRVSYLDLDGNRLEYVAEELASHCVQHEIDHINGVLFVDYLSRLKRNMMIRKVEKSKQQSEIL